MTGEERLRDAFAGIEVNGDFTEATLKLQDQSRLQFRHCVGERWAKPLDGETTLAAQVLARIRLFRLNRRHLDIQFVDGTRWEALWG